MITEARSFMVQAWWMIWLPGIALMVMSFTGNLTGDWSATRSTRGCATCASCTIS